MLSQYLSPLKSVFGRSKILSYRRLFSAPCYNFTVKNQDNEQQSKPHDCLVLHPIMHPNMGPELEL